MNLKDSLKTLENIINKFEFLIEHQVYYLDEHEFELKNQIDIQREILLSNINKISKRFIAKIELFNNDCKNNISKIKKFDLRYLRDELIRLIHEEQETKSKIETESLLKNLKVIIDLAQNEIEKYQNELKMNKIVKFEPINFVDDIDLFGNFSIKQNEIDISTENLSLICVKTLNDVSSDINLSIELIDDNRVAVGTKSGIIKVWNINSAELIQTLSKDGHQSSITCIKWLNKSNILASGSEDQTIKVWDLNTGQLIKTLIEHSGKIMNLCFSELYLISGSCDNTIKLWDIKQFNHLNTLNEHNGCVNDVKCLNNLLISGSSDKTVKIWCINYLKLIKTLHGHLEGVIQISLIPNKNDLMISYSTDSMLKIWDIGKGECIKCSVLSKDFTYENVILRLISKHLLVTVHSFKRGKWAFSIWDLERFVCIKKFKEFKGEVYDIKINPNNLKMYLASWDFRENDEFGCPVTIWKIK
jgi:WD40 repeat protein